MNKLLYGLQKENNIIYTENGAQAYRSTLNHVLDLFALGGSYRSRSDKECIDLFKAALNEDKSLAMKCLFYLGDVRGGQAERRFFKVCYNWLAKNDPITAKEHMSYIPEYNRWDSLYCLLDTPLEEDMFILIQKQLIEDLNSEQPSLLAKWLKSENATSTETKKIAERTRKALKLSAKEYRQMLSLLRKRIKVLEVDMCANKWDNIEFDKIPSCAGLKYRKCFTYRPETAKRYNEFIMDKNTKVNATVLNPVNITSKILNQYYISETEIESLEKYWSNLKDYYNGKEECGIAVIDVSGSMVGQPITAAIGMGMYIAERGKGPFANHFITFSENPSLIKVKGDNIVDKIQNIEQSTWGYNTNIEKVFNLILMTAIQNKCTQKDFPTRIYIFSDMEFDRAAEMDEKEYYNLFENVIKPRYAAAGYEVPHLIFWNLDARQNNIPALDGVYSYVSGFSMNMIENILSGKTGWELCLEKLLSDRYKVIGQK